jgi:hypothetical protein
LGANLTISWIVGCDKAMLSSSSLRFFASIPRACNVAGRPLAMIFDRIKAQVHQLQRFVRKAVEDPMVVTEWLGIGQSDAEGSMTMDEFGLQKGERSANRLSAHIESSTCLSVRWVKLRPLVHLVMK